MKIFMVLFVMVVWAFPMSGQTKIPLSSLPPFTEPDAWELVQDTLYVLRKHATHTVPRHMACASYTYSMRYDSLCEVEYLLTEWKRNGIPVRMPTWENGRVVNAPANYIAFNSQTDTFTCRVGDTLSFFRWFSWQSLQPSGSGYAALDTLDFAMELVGYDDSSRVALIDSMGALPRTTPGRPSFYGSYPLMGLVSYIVPSHLDGVRAFMRMRLYHRGSGEYWFTRQDGHTVHISGLMNEPWYQGHIAYYSPNGFRREVRERATDRSATERLQVLGDGIGSPYVKIRFEGAPLGLTTTILITDINGNNQFYPMLGAPDIEGRVEFPYKFGQSGSYLIALIHQGQLQEVVRWNVTQ